MKKSFEIINDTLIDIFGDIMSIQEEFIRTRGREEFKKLSVVEIHTVEAIGNSSPHTMSNIAKDLDITVGTLTIAVNKLIRKGYVERNRSAKDKRVVLITLTELGKELYDVHERFHEEMIKNTITGLTEEEESILSVSLMKLSKYINEMGKELMKDGK